MSTNRRRNSHWGFGGLLLPIAVSLLVLTSGPALRADDLYEQNDTLATAYVGLTEGTWLSTIAGVGYQSDDDWYRIVVMPQGYERVQVNCLFSDAAGDIDIGLYDAAGTWLGGSTSVTDNEFIDRIVPGPGTYYIRVYFQNAGNAYNLWWDDLPVTDDAYEENDTRLTAFDLSSMENRWLSTFLGAGVQADSDWYRITVNSGVERVRVLCKFSDAAGDIDIGLYNSAGTLLSGSFSVTDNEIIDHVVPSSGTYYILVYFASQSNTYDLWWDDLSPSPIYWMPEGWVWSASWPYVYEVLWEQWFYMQPSSSQWVYDTIGGGWSTIQTSALASGWVYYMWPYAYSMNAGRWFYIDVNGGQWSFNYKFSRWEIFGTP